MCRSLNQWPPQHPIIGTAKCLLGPAWWETRRLKKRKKEEKKTTKRNLKILWELFTFDLSYSSFPLSSQTHFTASYPLSSNFNTNYAFLFAMWKRKQLNPAISIMVHAENYKANVSKKIKLILAQTSVLASFSDNECPLEISLFYGVYHIQSIN